MLLNATTYDDNQGWSGLPDDRSVRGEYGPNGISLRLRGRSVLFDTDLAPDEIGELLATASRLKGMRKSGIPHTYLTGKTLGLVFQHPSTRTRTAFQVGMEQLGGQAIFLGADDLQLRRGETIEDTAEIMSLYLDAVAVRVASHQDLIDFAAGASVPVFNGLTEKSHPIEALGDVFTLQERFGDLQGQTFAYLGDGNNMTRSLVVAGRIAGVEVAVATPPELSLPDAPAVSIEDAVEGAHALYTDVWFSMGDEAIDADRRRELLAPFRIDAELLGRAREDAIVLHCLPAHPGEEITADVIYGDRSAVWDQAENRLHAQKALLELLLS
jgi:ornithine carbamoyltransferase